MRTGRRRPAPNPRLGWRIRRRLCCCNLLGLDTFLLSTACLLLLLFGLLHTTRATLHRCSIGRRSWLQRLLNVAAATFCLYKLFHFLQLLNRRCPRQPFDSRQSAGLHIQQNIARSIQAIPWRERCRLQVEKASLVDLFIQAVIEGLIPLNNLSGNTCCISFEVHPRDVITAADTPRVVVFPIKRIQKVLHPFDGRRPQGCHRQNGLCLQC